jgi:hypothetical protein
MSKLYAQAWNELEKADMRLSRTADIMRPEYLFNPKIKRDYISKSYWTDARVETWKRDDEKARQAADAAITKAANTLAKLQSMVEKATTNREYAKCVAARIEMTHAIWQEAYSRTMPKEWKK